MGFIDQPQQLGWRKLVFQIHLWAGILLALYLVLISLSGCVLIFGNEIMDDAPRLSSHRIQVNARALEFAASTARRLHAEYNIRSIRISREPGNASRIDIWKSAEADGRTEEISRSLYFNPSTGQIVSEVNRDKIHPFYGFMEELHTGLFLGRSPGRPINGVCAALLLLLCLTGVLIWWPGRRRWRDALSIGWGSNWKRINFDAHRAIGFWTLSIICVWAITGIYFGYPKPVRNALAHIMPFAEDMPPPKTGWKIGDPVLSMDNLYRDAQRMRPGEFIDRISLPSKTGQPVYVSFVSNRSPEFLHYEEVALNPGNGDILHFRDDWNQGKAGDLFLNALFMLHFAGFSGLPIRIFLALLGLSPAALAITGVLMWWNRVLSKKWMASQETLNPKLAGSER